MTDRELLELAAKAAGKDIDLSRYDEDWGFAIRHMAKWWNPLTDDGDALRLAVKLRMCVNIWKYFVDADGEVVDYQNDPYEAARRAIVRAAAEHGKAMK